MNRAKLKTKAKKMFISNYLPTLGACLIPSALAVAIMFLVALISSVPNILFRLFPPIGIVLFFAFTIITTLIYFVVSVVASLGQITYLRKYVDSEVNETKEPDISSVFDPFKYSWVPLIVRAYFKQMAFPLLLFIVSSLLSNVIGLLVSSIGILSILVGLLGFVASVAAYVIGLIKLLEGWYISFLCSENLDETPEGIIALSKKMTEGHKKELFILQLSFLGWVIVGLIPCGLGIPLWTIPYMETTFALEYVERRDTFEENED